MGALLTGAVIIPMNNVNAASTDAPTITYQAHVENKGWMDKVSTSTKDAYAGTQGQALRMEALRIKLEGLDDVTLSYKAHIENIGDKTFDSDAEIIGTEGQALRLEAITVNADGIEDTDYSLQYRVHIENEGTTGWVNAGEEAGSRGKAQRLESIEFRLLSKTEQELEDAKAQAIAQLKKEFKREDYTLSEKKYDTMMETAEKNINGARDVAAVVTKLKAEQANFKNPTNIKTDEEQLKTLAGEKEALIDGDFKTFYNNVKSAGTPAIVKAVVNTRKAAEDIIYSASSKEEMDNVSFLKAKELILDAVIEAAEAESEKLYNDGDGSADPKYLKTDAYNEIKKLLDGVTVDTLVATLSTATTNYGTEIAKIDTLTGLKGTAMSDFTTATDALRGNTSKYKDVAKIQDAVAEADKALKKTFDTHDELIAAENSANSVVLKAVKDYVEEKVEEYNGKAVDGYTLSSSEYNNLVKELKDAKDVTEALAIMDKIDKTNATACVLDNLNTFITSQEGILDAYAADFDATGAAEIVTKAKEEFKKAASRDAIFKIEQDAEAELLQNEKDGYVAKFDNIEEEKFVEIGGATYNFKKGSIATARTAIRNAKSATAVHNAYNNALKEAKKSA